MCRVYLRFFNFLSTISTEIFIEKNEKLGNVTYVSQKRLLSSIIPLDSQTWRMHTSTKIRILKSERYSIRHYRIHEKKYRILEAERSK